MACTDLLHGSKLHYHFVKCFMPLLLNGLHGRNNVYALYVCFYKQYNKQYGYHRHGCVNIALHSKAIDVKVIKSIDCKANPYLSKHL
jgi:hypothetical protein